MSFISEENASVTLKPMCDTAIQSWTAEKSKSPNNIERIIIILAILSNRYTTVIPKYYTKGVEGLWAENNGMGDRWAYKQTNFSTIYSNGTTKLYSDNLEDTIPPERLNEFLRGHKKSGPKRIVGFYVHSLKDFDAPRRTISAWVKRAVYKRDNHMCVACSSRSNLDVDHKNDWYEFSKDLDVKTQHPDAFQLLCASCNLRKRSACAVAKKTHQFMPFSQVPQFKVIYNGYIPREHMFAIDQDKYWEDSEFTKGSYWFDPVYFNAHVVWIINITHLNIVFNNDWVSSKKAAAADKVSFVEWMIQNKRLNTNLKRAMRQAGKKDAIRTRRRKLDHPFVLILVDEDGNPE